MIRSEANVRNSGNVMFSRYPTKWQQSNKEDKREKLTFKIWTNWPWARAKSDYYDVLFHELCAIAGLMFNLCIQANEVFSLIVFTWITITIFIARCHIHVFSPISMYYVIIAIIVTKNRLFEMFEGHPAEGDENYVQLCVTIETWLALWILLSAHWDKNIWASTVRNINLCVYEESSKC